ncbi:endogenous retrovirus group K member 25 Env polyprotein-like [Saimiri boliviensis]|uniref:endogenous retrovirus group K member 25 Env polyprotein-like n=1 Tax=Saimiri boliviensis TaxID=27679 RepID=UPI003D781B9F
MDQFDGRTNTLIPRFRRLTLTPPPHRRRRRLRRTQRICTPLHGNALPTWSQLRRLTAEATQLVLEQGHSRSPAVMFIAMMAILSCQVSPSQAHSADSSQILWAYVPDPPILRPVTWTDPAFPVYLNDTSLFGFPSSTHITPQTANYSYFAQAASPPMCFYASKIWDQLALNIRIPFLPILPSTNGPFCFELGMKHLTTFEGPSALLKGETSFYARDWLLTYLGIKESWNSSSPDFPSIPRSRCHAVNSSFDPSPPWKLCYPKQRTALTYTLSSGFTLYDWSLPAPLSTSFDRYQSPGGWATPIFSTSSGRTYTSLWRLFTALTPSYWKAGTRSVSYPSHSQHYVQACVASPYALLYGHINISVSSGHYHISCPSCTLTNCIDSSIFPAHTILVVHQPPYVMLPVNVSGPWYDEYSLQILHDIRDLIVRPKRFLGILIASILTIVSVVATAATAAVSLAHSIQAATFVNHLAHNVSVSLGTQIDIDSKLEAKLNALEQTVTVLGDKVHNLQSRLRFRCHADYNSICVTSAPYNDSEWDWPLVRAHLQGIWSHNNLSLDIFRLQRQIHAIDFSRRQLPQDATIARDIVDTLSSWTRGFHLPSLSTLIGIGGFLLVLIILLPFLFRLVFSSLQHLQLKLFELHLKTKKEGIVGNAPV